MDELKINIEGRWVKPSQIVGVREHAKAGWSVISIQHEGYILDRALRTPMDEILAVVPHLQENPSD